MVRGAAWCGVQRAWGMQHELRGSGLDRKVGRGRGRGRGRGPRMRARAGPGAEGVGSGDGADGWGEGAVGGRTVPPSSMTHTSGGPFWPSVAMCATRSTQSCFGSGFGLGFG